MRSEKEMYALILSTAQQDSRVRAVGMNGSRVNPKAPQDRFQDYDIVYFVTEMDSFLADSSWIDPFGERIMMQQPEAMTLFPPTLTECFTYLMLFTDGNRLDLMLRPVSHIDVWREEDKLAKVLLDKDDQMGPLQLPSDETFWVKRPTQATFTDCCNEFWWLTTYVVKGLERGEVIYAYDHLQFVRDMFLQMIEWKVGIQTDFTVSIGKNAKYLKRYVDHELWVTLIESYPQCNAQAIKRALDLLMTEFERLAIEIASTLNFNHFEEAEKVKEYLKRKNANE